MASELQISERAAALRRRGIVVRGPFSTALRRLLKPLRESETALILIAAAVGFIVGGIVALITRAVAFLHWLLFGVEFSGHLSASESLPEVNLLIVPICGGILIGLISFLIRRLRAREIVDPIEANALYGGRMSLSDSFTLALITVITVGFGGSAGLEAADTQLGSGFASKIGRAIRLRRQDLRILVGCGSAAAISAAFNSPLAGAFYAFELIIGSYTLQSLAPIASAALCGDLAIAAISDPEPLFLVPGPLTLQTHDYALFVLLGLAAAMLSIVIMMAVTVVESQLRQHNIPGWLKPILGGTGVGLAALFYPDVLGSGHGAISNHLHGNVDLQMLAGLLLTKMLASALTVGSGMRGGLFSSSLFLGTIFGGLIAGGLSVVAPQLSVNPTAYSLVGMAAVAGGVVGAPITMILLVLETTGNFSLTIGVTASVIASTVAVRQSFGYSFATWRFHVRGLRIAGAHDVGWISDLTVGRLMRHDFRQVPASTKISTLRKKFPPGGPKYAFVIDNEGAFIGTIETVEAHSPEFDGIAQETTVEALIHNEPAVLTRAENIHAAIMMFGRTSSEVLPVVDNTPSMHIVGCVTEAYVLRRYSQELERRRLEESNGGVLGPNPPS